MDTNNLIDLSNSKVIPIPLGGAMTKLAVEYNNSIYMLKFDKEGSRATVSEYIASKLAHELDIICQEVFLATYNGKRCCAIKLFTEFSNKIHCYREINDSSFSGDMDVRELPYNLELIDSVIRDYKNTESTVEDRITFFQLMCYFDTLIGNFDRHWGNWGLVGSNKKYEISPLFDNGSSLFPKIKIEDIDRINNSDEELLLRVFTFPTSAIKNSNNKKSTYKELVNNLCNLYGKEVLKDFCERVDSVDFENLIYNDLILENVLTLGEKVFLVKILKLRFNLLLKEVIK